MCVSCVSRCSPCHTRRWIIAVSPRAVVSGYGRVSGRVCVHTGVLCVYRCGCNVDAYLPAPLSSPDPAEDDLVLSVEEAENILKVRWRGCCCGFLLLVVLFRAQLQHRCVR